MFQIRQSITKIQLISPLIPQQTVLQVFLHPIVAIIKVIKRTLVINLRTGLIVINNHQYIHGVRIMKTLQTFQITLLGLALNCSNCLVNWLIDKISTVLNRSIRIIVKLKRVFPRNLRIQVKI